MRARLFGLPLLRLRARVRVIPTDAEPIVVVAGRDVEPRRHEPVPPGRLEDARRALDAARRILSELER